MSTYPASPGARVLWCLRRKRSDIRCVQLDTTPIEIRILQDADVVLKEMFFEETSALNWASAFATRLKEQGWRDSPAERSPSSAA